MYPHGAWVARSGRVRHPGSRTDAHDTTSGVIPGAAQPGIGDDRSPLYAGSDSRRPVIWWEVTARRDEWLVRNCQAISLRVGRWRWLSHRIEGIAQALRPPRQLLQLALLPLLICFLCTFLAIRLLGRQ